MLKTLIPQSKSKIQAQLKTLECILKKDSKPEDVEMYHQTMIALKEAIHALEIVENTPSPAGRKPSAPYEKIISLKEQGMTHEAIARDVGVSLSTVNRAVKKYKES